MDVDDILNEMDDTNFERELPSCQHFLVDSELEGGRQKVFLYRMKNFNATIVDEKPDHFLNNHKCAAKVNLTFAFILKKIEEGNIRYF